MQVMRMKAPKATFVVLISTALPLIFFLIVDYSIGQDIVSKKKLGLPLNQRPEISLDNKWYELKKSFDGKDQSGPFVFPVTTDKWGFRKNPLNDDSIESDIIFLGDSFTYGVALDWGDTFVGIFEKNYNKRITNAGVSSYSPTPYLHQYKKFLSSRKERKKHIVIIGLDISDVQDEATRWDAGDLHPKMLSFAPSKSNKSKVTTTNRGLFNQLPLMFPLTTQTYNALFDEKPSEDMVKFYAGSYKRSAFTWEDWGALNEKNYPDGYAPLGVSGGLNKVESNLREISELAKNNSGSIYILIYPWPAQVMYSDKFSWSKFAEQLCNKNNCSGVIDLIPEFRQLSRADRDWYTKYYIYNDIHFNKNGNKVVAEAIQRSIRN